MTGAQRGDFGRPITPAAGADRSTLGDQLAEALETRLRKVIGRSPNPEMVRELTEAGLPVVKRAQVVAAAEALEQAAADWPPTWAASPDRYMRDRAADLRSQGDAE